MIIVAIDEIDIKKARELVDNLDPKKCMLKIGSVSFNSIGKEIIYYAAEKEFDIFLDLKLHDIPNTVKKSIEGISVFPISMITIHTSGGRDMMNAAMEAVRGKEIKVFGVTALTSLNDKDTNEIFKRNVFDQVNKMLDLAELTCIDGVVCSPYELEFVKKRESLLSITPGIRLKDLNDDQKRFMTPKEAINNGSDYLVIGRPITAAKNVGEALDEIYRSIS